MLDYCPYCKSRLGADHRCPYQSDERHPVSERPTSLRVLPRAPRGRRLLGAGLEYVTYEVGLAAIAFISFMTVGVGDAAVALPLLILIAIRDSRSGLFSIEKRFAHLRVVKAGSGQPIRDLDGLKRNFYYLIPPLVALLPFLPLDYLVVSIFQALLILDILMILFRQDGRRLGDLLAGTQVVPASQEPNG